MASRTCAGVPLPLPPSNYLWTPPVLRVLACAVACVHVEEGRRAYARVRVHARVCACVLAEGRADDRSKRSSRCEYVIRNRPRHTATDRRCTDSTRALSSQPGDTELTPYSCASIARFSAQSIGCVLYKRPFSRKSVRENRSRVPREFQTKFHEICFHSDARFCVVLGFADEATSVK